MGSSSYMIVTSGPVSHYFNQNHEECHGYEIIDEAICDGTERFQQLVWETKV